MGLRSRARRDRRARRRNGAAAGPPRVDAAVARFMLGSLAAVAVIVIGGFLALRNVALEEAEGDTRDRVRAGGQLVEAAGLQDGILRGDPEAIRHLDDLVQGQVIDDSIVRVKLWTKGGRIIYSDEPALIGSRFALGDEEVALFAAGGADAELSDLSHPENRYERPQASCSRRTRRSARPAGRSCCSRSTSATARSTRAASGCWARSHPR